MFNKKLEMAKEVARVYRDTLDYKASYRQVVEQYKKAQSLATTQEKEHEKTFNDILTDKVDIDNGQVYDMDSGQTIKDLI